MFNKNSEKTCFGFDELNRKNSFPIKLGLFITRSNTTPIKFPESIK
jgi:hypothetical protein